MCTRRVLVIAGSDSSGGAGLEADQKVLAAHGVYAMTATTALTAQNTLGVEEVHIVPPDFVGKQIRQVLGDVGCDVVKMGTCEVRRAVSSGLRKDVGHFHFSGSQWAYLNADLPMSQGMLATARTIEVVAATLKEYDVTAIVLDPVGYRHAKHGTFLS
jgi:hydroxymethylpyrimidine/phosphomethylpyrimidine kinase